MNTNEHTELGNRLRFENLVNNPYLRIDEQGTLHIKLQRCENGLPSPMNLEMSAGEIIAMAADFFTDRNWNMKLDLPSFHSFKTAASFSHNSSRSMGEYLIEKPLQPEEEEAFLNAYNSLASPAVTRKDIDRIYKIDGSTYIPFSSTLNDYVKQLMFFLRVKDYGEMLNRNQTHFTPWAVRVYVLGHSQALSYARLAFELGQCLKDSAYQSNNPDFQNLIHNLKEENQELNQESIQELMHRYQALALCLELFVFHYYSDHFAAGHMAMVGDLRVLLGERFGVWGNILANNLHNELNRLGVLTKKPYDPTPSPTEAPTPAGGDGSFDGCLNHHNKQACLAGMQASLLDLQHVLAGEPMPKPKNYGGLEYLPDVDFNVRQLQPVILLGDDLKIYYREQLSVVKTLSPLDYKKMQAAPGQWGYVEIKNKWDAFWLTAKLRLLPFIYEGKVQAPSAAELLRIEQEEQVLNPDRAPIPSPSCEVELCSKPASTSWNKSGSREQLLEGLSRNSLLAKRQKTDFSEEAPSLDKQMSL
ncbi:hypothetical protein [Legionella jordanis]|uniref:Dot/Icm secretion system substrate n=1 Tax=Legionella jordanis TaxID=456 RepID=A0A0W0VCJ9_9GAMM|nr:hypothetical protein [Legionella jordanis]KTD17861.1 Dot/Icm secretion system substrate [Legionella jordanis]RMX02440.1 type IV secretion protein Dot [Legionella jordanis]VEH11202.1 Dot/Icm T4SS effector [Legionella jordanis]